MVSTTVLVYLAFMVLSGYSGYLVYSGIATEEDKIVGKLEIKQFFARTGLGKQDENEEENELEKKFTEAGNPLGLTAHKYVLGYYGVLIVLIIAYVITPMLQGNTLGTYATVAIGMYLVAFHPQLKFGVVHFALNKYIENKKIKLQTELFTFFDLILGRVRTMSHGRVNTYSIIRDIYPEFTELSPSLSRLLLNWNRDGSSKTLDVWVEEVGTKEASSLAGVLKELDNNDIDVAIHSLEGQQSMFLMQKLETTRRTIKLRADIGKVPLWGAFGLTMAYFMSMIIIMTLDIINETSL